MELLSIVGTVIVVAILGVGVFDFLGVFTRRQYPRNER